MASVLKTEDRGTEETLMGSLILRGAAAALDALALVPEAFYYREHQAIYQALLDIRDTGGPIDLVSVVEYLDRHGRLDECGGETYLIRLVRDASLPGEHTDTLQTHYREVILHYSRLRDAQTLLTRAPTLLARADNSETAAVELAEAISQLYEEGGKGSPIQGLTDDLNAFEEKAKFRQINQIALLGPSTGLVTLDNLSDGLQPGTLVGLGGARSVGKSALALNVAQAVADESPRQALYVSYEMTREQIFWRNVSARSQLDGRKLKLGEQYRNEPALLRYEQARDHLKAHPLMVCEDSGTGMAELRAMAKSHQRQQGLQLVVVDYLHLMPAPKSENRNQDLGGLTRELKRLAKDLNLCVLLVLSLNRQFESMPDKKPELAHIRDSGEIEFHLDQCWLLWNPSFGETYPGGVQVTGTEEAVTIGIRMAKYRDGPLGEAELDFYGGQFRFDDGGVAPAQPYGLAGGGLNRFYQGAVHE